MMDDNVFLTVEQAIAMLPNTEEIHTFCSLGFGVLGASWTREEVIGLIENAPEGGIRLAGETATKMGHKLAVVEAKGRVHFIETTPESA
ncbi:MAG: hypothetical protein ACYC36_13320 [Bellilinea sp.]